MAREKPPPEKEGDVPAWFMTYSDVITLLMTFFILLMTFATNEPERFERMQVSMFGGSGATGLAGAESTVEFDAMLTRQRPRSARVSMRGSETAPIDSEAGIKALDKGLEGLDGPQKFDPHRSFKIDIQIADLFTSSGQLSSEGKQHLFVASKRVKQGDIRATIRAEPNELDRCFQIAEFLLKSGGLEPTDVGVGAWLGQSARGKIQLELQQMGKER